MFPILLSKLFLLTLLLFLFLKGMLFAKELLYLKEETLLKVTLIQFLQTSHYIKRDIHLHGQTVLTYISKAKMLC